MHFEALSDMPETRLADISTLTGCGCNGCREHVSLGDVYCRPGYTGVCLTQWTIVAAAVEKAVSCGCGRGRENPFGPITLWICHLQLQLVNRYPGQQGT
jgi:hypothetical protein